MTRPRQGNTTQRWLLTHQGSNSYTVRQRSSGRFLDAHEGADQDYRLVTRPRQDNATQDWIVNMDASGNATIQQRSNLRYVDAHVIADRDFEVVTRTFQSNDTQKWLLTPVSSAPRPDAAVPSAAVRAALRFRIATDMKPRLKMIQWSFEANTEGRPILSGNRYRLVNAVNGRGIRQQKRFNNAINLGWLDPSSDAFNVFVRRKNGDGELRYGDAVALHVQDQGWLYYGKRGWDGGINLKHDREIASRSFDWTVMGGRQGDRVKSGMPVALRLYGDRANHFMRYCERNIGIDLGWEDSDCGGFFSEGMVTVFGPNGLLNSKDGWTGVAYKKGAAHLCEVGVDAALAAAVAGATAASGGVGAVSATAALAARPYAIGECEDALGL